ncbi:MAG TPA: NAD(P)H-dependent oxidoreductase [Candidatus Paceibacterota bacterium]|nr:NAD(P)H-dependent oxidoreductase [Candidatus Paceibacterota bacterium]
MDPIKIKVIIGSTRPGRFSEKPARWIFEEAKKVEGVEAELLDLRDYPLPFFDEALPPSMTKEPYANPVVQQWTAKIADGDAFIVLTPEYNHGPSAVLKNAIDYVGKEWNKKPVGYVSWGSVSGARVVEMLRLTAVELQMAPIRQALYLPGTVYMAVKDVPTEAIKPEMFEAVAPAQAAFFAQLMWWARALKTARSAG